MAIVKSVRLVATKAGSVLDSEDRKVLGQALVIAGGVLGVAGVSGLAIRIFFVAMG